MQDKPTGLSRRRALKAALGAAAAAPLLPSQAQTPVAGAAAPTVQPQPFPGVIGTTLDNSRPYYPPPRLPPPGSPNVLVIVLDDVGFSDLGCYGSEIPTPHLDKLAGGGLRYTNFRTAAMCSPTRAALMTGLNQHSAGMGWLADVDNGYPGYRGDLTLEAPTLAETLRDTGYNTFHIGKWHVNSERSNTPMGPMHNWPLARGFERAYWYQGHSVDFFRPVDFYDGNEEIEAERPANYYVTDDLTDRAIANLRQQRLLNPARPFYMQLAHNAAHSPLQVPLADRDRHRGRYDAGWDHLREQRLARQKQLGLFDASVALPPRNPGIKAWDDLPAPERKLFARYMEIYAAMIERLDRNIGRVTDYLREAGELDNTLILVLSDNGGSPEGTMDGTPNLLATAVGVDISTQQALGMLDAMGGPDTYPHYPMGWAMASNTPFKMYKQFSFLGGIADPLIVHWPKLIKDAGALRSQYVHVTDIVPTLLQATAVGAPSLYRGRPVKPIEGTSFFETLQSAGAASRHLEQHFELGGQRAYYDNGWSLVALHQRGTPYAQDRWELYDLRSDPNEARDLATQLPDKVREMAAKWERAAQRHNVYPLDDRNVIVKILQERRRQPQRARWVFTPPLAPLSGAVGPQTGGRSHVLTAQLASTGEGVIAALGNLYAGWVLYVKNGRLVYELSHTPHLDRIETTRALPAGRCTVVCEVQMIQRPFSAKVLLRVDGTLVGEGSIARVLAAAPPEGFSLGEDANAPVSKAYGGHGKFKGVIEKVQIDIDLSPPTLEEVQRFMRSIRINV